MNLFMNNFKLLFSHFLSQNKYLTEKEYEEFLLSYKNDLNPKHYHQLLIEKTQYLRIHNNKYLNKILKEKKEYFNQMFESQDSNIKLDSEQLKAIIADENLLVIAGAGAGKTTTMAAKVKYLVDSGYKEQEILVISFTKKACEEIGKIIHNTLNCPNVKVTTFHSLGLDLIKNSGRDIDKIIEDVHKYKIISNFIKEIAFQDKPYLKDLVLAFKSYLLINEEEALKYDNFEDFHEKNYFLKYQSTGFDLENYNNIQIKNRRNRKKTIKGEFLRSKEEVDIANFLYLNGIDYSYEVTYKERKDNIKTHPDFYIKQLENSNYIEHFGVDENLDNSMYDESQLKGYLNTLKLKHDYINQEDHSKLFIVTYSKYQDKRTYLKDLKEQLIKKGYSLTKKTAEEVFKTLMKTDTDSYFNKFIYDIVIPFISIFKRSNYQKEDFKILMKNTTTDLRKQLEVIEKIYDYYQDALEKKHYIDFDDMINLAYQVIPSLKESDLGVDYKYLIIDEYQDISSQRYNLTSSLAKLYDAKIMAVGDDWQTIYSFAGANISLFRDFKKYVEHAKKIPIKNTYRNSQELIDIAGEFIKKNKFQIKKELKSNKHLANPIEIVVYEDSKREVEDYTNALAISSIITKITSSNPKHKILLLGRYNKDKDMLLYTDYFTEYRGKIKSKLNPDADITFLTIHKSKGVGFDDVILVNGSDKLYGFPSKIEDKPIIKLLKQEPDEMIKYPEERRLFYVAMTRTKNKFYITVPKSKKSIFVNEIAKYNNVITNKEIIKYDSKIKTNYTCPKCSNKLYMINYKKTGFYIYSCEDPDCHFQTMFPKALEELEKCPICGEIVTYRYTNKDEDRIYKCLNGSCNYTKVKNKYSETLSR